MKSIRAYIHFQMRHTWWFGRWSVFGVTLFDERLGPVLHTCHVNAVRLCGEPMPAQHKTKQLVQLGIKTHARMHQAS